MMIFKTINGLLKGTRYIVLALSALGILGSILLFCMNIALGLSTTGIFIASFLGCLGVILLLAPTTFTNRLLRLESFMSKRYMIAIAFLVIAIVMVGLAYMNTGDFPPMNIPFMDI